MQLSVTNNTGNLASRNHKGAESRAEEVSCCADLQARRWACDACGSPYDLDHMEARLVSIVQSRARSYQLQDVKCSKCRRVRLHEGILQCWLKTQCAGSRLAQNYVSGHAPAFVCHVSVIRSLPAEWQA